MSPKNGKGLWLKFHYINFQSTISTICQEIDLGGAFEPKLYDEAAKKMIPIPADFSKIKVMNIEDLKINVVDANDLMNYKKLLEGKGYKHQTGDIEAVKRYLVRNKLKTN